MRTQPDNLPPTELALRTGQAVSTTLPARPSLFWTHYGAWNLTTRTLYATFASQHVADNFGRLVPAYRLLSNGMGSA